jgi:mannosyltransferase
MKRLDSLPSALLIIFTLAALLRGLGINQRPLWYDEAFSVLYAEKGMQAMLSVTGSGAQAAAGEEHPLGYYLFLWVWMRIFGESPLAVRSLSVLVGLGSLALVYLFTRRLFNPRLALYLGMLAAVSPFQVHYSQEVRMYALLAFFLILCTWSLWEGMRSQAWGWWLVFSLSAASAQYTHHLAAFYLFPLALTPLITRNARAVKRLVLATLGALLLYLPWLVRLPAQFAKIEGAYWTQSPGIDRLVTTLLSFVVNLPLPPGWLPAALFDSLFLTGLAAWQTVKLVRQHSPGWKAGVWLAYLGTIPVLLLFLFSQWKAVFIERGLLASGLVFLVWLGWALFYSRLPSIIQALVVGLLAAAVVMGIYQHVTYQGFPYAPFEALDASLRSRLSPQDIILHSNKLSFLPCLYYDRSLQQRFMADATDSGSATLAKATQKVLGIHAYDSMAEAIGDSRRVWFVIFEKALQEYSSEGVSDQPHLAWLSAHYQLEKTETWGDLRVYVFTHP